MVSADGKDHRPIGAGRLARWSPDGSKLAHRKQSQLWVRWMDTGAETPVTSVDTPPVALSWSPDGTQLAFLPRVAGTPEWSIKMPKPPAGAKWAEPPSVVTRLRWRADGLGGAGLIPEGFTHLFVVPATGGEPAWTPDGKTIYLHAARRPTRITQANGPEQNPVVSPDGSDARRLAQGLDRNVSTPVRAAVGGHRLRRRPSHNSRPPRPNRHHRLGAVEEIRYPSFDPAKKNIHGIEFNHQMQMYPARGFVVLYTNPRGSTGYGESFASVTHWSASMPSPNTPSSTGSPRPLQPTSAC